MYFKSSVALPRDGRVEHMVSVPLREALKLNICSNVCEGHSVFLYGGWGENTKHNFVFEIKEERG